MRGQLIYIYKSVLTPPFQQRQKSTPEKLRFVFASIKRNCKRTRGHSPDANRARVPFASPIRDRFTQRNKRVEITWRAFWSGFVTVASKPHRTRWYRVGRFYADEISQKLFLKQQHQHQHTYCRGRDTQLLRLGEGSVRLPARGRFIFLEEHSGD